MRWLIVASAALALGCSSVKPLPVMVGDRCFRCQRPIDEARLAGELIDEGGHAFKFRTAGCMAKYVAEHKGEHYRGLFVTDYQTGKFIAASKATFVRMTINSASLEQDYAAFGSEAAAGEHARKTGGTMLEWEAVLASSATP